MDILLSVCFMVITNETFELGILQLVWRYVMNIPAVHMKCCLSDNSHEHSKTTRTICLILTL
jgi:hypothetical protein